MHYKTIDALSRSIKTGNVSPVELVEACLKRIDELDPKLNVFITVLADESRAAARQAEVDVRSGNWRGPLHGIPVAVKDFYDMKDVRTTAGAEQLKDRIANDDAAVVARLKAAGAIIVGKTNMDAFGMATTGLTSYFGPVKNPWNETYVAGGSSAGSAAAVAAGLCYATVDTDAVGSVRLPASCCGVSGFKGSYGLVSMQGILGDETPDDFIRLMSHGAITTRGMLDTALMLDVLADDTSHDYTQALLTTAKDKKLRIGIGTRVAASPSITAVFREAVAIYKNAGYDVVEVEVPFVNPLHDGIDRIAEDRRTIAKQSFADVDAIILPTIKHDVPTREAARSNPEQAVSAELTVIANYYGLPAVSVPCGFDGHRMPMGIQVIAAPGKDAVALALAHVFEEAAGVYEKHPLP